MNRAWKSLICAPRVTWEDPVKIDGYCVQHLYQTILGLQIHLTLHSGDISKQVQKKPFHVFAVSIPEAGFRAPESGFQGVTLHRLCVEVTGRSTKIRETGSAEWDLEWLPTCIVMARGRIPNDDLHESLSEGEGACSRICDGRSHLPLRGKLGWMTPRPGQKRAGKRNASLGLSFPSGGPFYFLALMSRPTRFRPAS